MSTEELKGALMAVNKNTAVASRSMETASAAVAAQARAMVEARYAVAYARPRDWDVVRQKLLTECRRPTFAHNKSAFYVKPIGNGVEGLGIRFTEVAFRCMTNVTTEVITVYEDEQRRIVRVTVTDLEANAAHTKDVTIIKSVERSKPMDDGSFISRRKNSYGKDVFTVPATNDEILNTEGALVSKTVRTLGFRVIPGDLQDEAEAIILAVRRDDAAKDPLEARKKLVDAFGGLGVSAEHLKEYLGHSLDKTTPDEIVHLRGIYGAIRDEETTWQAVMENKRQQAQDQDGRKAPAKEQPKQEPKAETAKPTPPPADAPVDKATGEIKSTEGRGEPTAGAPGAESTAPSSTSGDEPPEGHGRLYPTDAAPAKEPAPAQTRRQRRQGGQVS